MNGEVIYFSTDRINDERNGQSYYIARIRIAQKSLDKINYDVELYPGMPAEVLIEQSQNYYSNNQIVRNHMQGFL